MTEEEEKKVIKVEAKPAGKAKGTRKVEKFEDQTKTKTKKNEDE